MTSETTVNSCSQDSSLCNDSDCSERTSSDRMFIDYDLAIVERLHYLTQRVEDLERKLEKRMPKESDEMSFALSVNNNNSVPNVDIKVLAGPCGHYQNSAGDEELMGGWDDAIVEQNTSFLIIPVGNDKDSQLSEAQGLKQTIDGALEPTASLPVLCSTDLYEEIIAADGSKESLEVNETFFTPKRVISVSVFPSETVTAEENEESKTLESTSDSTSIKSEDFSSHDTRLKTSRGDEMKFDNGKEVERPEINGQQGMEKVIESMEKLETLSSSSRYDGSMRYGYTISVAGVSPKKSDNKTKILPFRQPHVFNFKGNNSLEQSGKDITSEVGHTEKTITSEDAFIRENKMDVVFPSCVVKSRILPLSESVCYEDVGIHEIYERNDDERGGLDRNEETRHKRSELVGVINDRTIRIDPGLYKREMINQNFVNSNTNYSHSIDKQLMDSKSTINGPRGSVMQSELEVNGAKDYGFSCDDLLIEKEVEEITSLGQNRFEDSMVTLDDKEDDRIEMQIEAARLQRCKDSYCSGNGTDKACLPGNNATAGNGLGNNKTNYNTSNLKDIEVVCYKANDTLHRNSRYRDVNKKVSPRKVRVRTLELPVTSSEEDLYVSSMMMKDGATLLSNPKKQSRPQRRKPRNRTTKASPRNSTSSSQPVQDLERQIKELIDPCEIGNLHEEMAAANRPLLLAVMSPTDSGYVGSNADSSPDAWKDYYDSAYSELSTPISTQVPIQPSNKYSNPSYSSALYSSPAVVTSANGKIDPTADPIEERHGRNVFLSPRSAYHSTGSRSSTSSTVSYIGGSDYSELYYSEDREAFQDLAFPPLQPLEINHELTRLNDYFSGPARLPFDNHSSHVRLNEYLLNRHPIASPTSSVATSDLSDSFFGCQSDYCECQTGIATQEDFREELKSISRYVLEARAKTGVTKKTSKSLKKFFLDEEQGEMDIFGAKLQKAEHKAVPMLVKVILRLRKHFFGGIEGPSSLKSLSPRQEKSAAESASRERKISFSPSAMLLSAVGESSASEIRDVIEKDQLDVNQPSPSGKTLLHKAAASGDLESIHTLIKYGAKVNLTDQDGFAPVHSALSRCHYKCAIFLMECGTDMGAYTRTRIQEISIIRNMSSEYMSSVLNTPL